MLYHFTSQNTQCWALESDIQWNIDLFHWSQADINKSKLNEQWNVLVISHTSAMNCTIV